MYMSPFSFLFVYVKRASLPMLHNHRGADVSWQCMPLYSYGEGPKRRIDIEYVAALPGAPCLPTCLGLVGRGVKPYSLVNPLLG